MPLPYPRIFKNLFVWKPSLGDYRSWIRLQLKPGTGMAFNMTEDADGIGGVLELQATASVPSPGTAVTTEKAFGQSENVGTATAYAREDHTHGTPAAPTAASVGALPMPGVGGLYWLVQFLGAQSRTTGVDGAAVSDVGTRATVFDATGWAVSYTAGAGVGSAMGFYQTADAVAGVCDPTVSMQYTSGADVTNTRFYLCLFDSTTPPNAAANTNAHIGFRAEPGGNWYVTRANGAVQAADVDTGMALTANQTLYAELTATGDGTSWTVSLGTSYPPTGFSATYTTTIPGASVGLRAAMYGYRTALLGTKLVILRGISCKKP